MLVVSLSLCHSLAFTLYQLRVMAEEKLCCKEAILEAVSGGAEQVMDLYLCEKN